MLFDVKYTIKDLLKELLQERLQHIKQDITLKDKDRWIQSTVVTFYRSKGA